MTTLIVLGSIAAYLVVWFLTARHRVSIWHRRGGSICSNGSLLESRYFDKSEDRPWIAFYALLLTFFWPITLPVQLMASSMFKPIDEHEERERKIQEARVAEVREWEDILRNATTDAERTTAHEVLKGLRAERERR